MSSRAMRKVTLSFGLVSIPVAVHKVANAEEVKFHRAHKADGGGVELKNFCKICAEEVAYADLGRAIELPDHTLQLITDDEAEALSGAKGENSNVAQVLQFADPDEVDLASLSTNYYLAPQPGGERAYALLRTALESTHLAGVVQIKLSTLGKEKIALLRVRDRVLMLTVILYDQEVRQPDFTFLNDADPALPASERSLAKDLVSAMADTFDPAAHKDDYREAAAQVAYAHASGTTVATPTKATPKPAGADMAAMLKASLENAARTKGKAAKAAPRKGAAAQKRRAS